MAANFSEMNRAILNYINSKIPKDTNQAQIGVVNGNRVACILPEKSNMAGKSLTVAPPFELPEYTIKP
ncbi:MAG: hypothetical protein IJQ82_11610, partial [Selenomonadaceae bacterium]|nr:hypothetical protein [Selenomonadaceae bacterium]